MRQLAGNENQVWSTAVQKAVAKLPALLHGYNPQRQPSNKMPAHRGCVRFHREHNGIRHIPDGWTQYCLPDFANHFPKPYNLHRPQNVLIFRSKGGSQYYLRTALEHGGAGGKHSGYDHE